jgi:pSer/pThr/pTyr-binding forkhead associated (FHA) protein
MSATEILIALMSGPQDGAMLMFETFLDSGKPTEITFGRREDCDVCLSYDSQVSREHAVLTFDGATFWLEDTHSTNGTYIGEERITARTEVAPGQLFRVGRTWLRVEPLPTVLASEDDLPF